MEHEMWCAEVQHKEECNCQVRSKKPTKEEVEAGIDESRQYNFSLNPQAAIYRKKYIVMAKACIALLEELTSARNVLLKEGVTIGELREAIDNLTTQRDQHKAENQALRTLMETTTINISSPMSVKPVEEEQA